MASPPAKEGLLGPLIGIGVGIWIVSQYAGAGMVVGIAIAGIAAWMVVARWFSNTFDWPGAYQYWRESWICLQGMHTFTPKVARGPAESSSGGAQLLPVIVTVAALAAGLYFTRGLWQTPPARHSAPVRAVATPSPAPSKVAAVKPGPSVVPSARGLGAGSTPSNALPLTVAADTLPLYAADTGDGPVMETLKRVDRVQRVLTLSAVLHESGRTAVKSPTGQIA